MESPTVESREFVPKTVSDVERPEVARVRTGNTSSNGPMPKINYEMGFRPHHTDIEWQVETARVREYLEG